MMRIGRRWGVGEPSPDTLPVGVRSAIVDEERTLVELGADTTDWRWTLTWLEGRPVVDLDDGTRITVDGGETVVTRD